MSCLITFSGCQSLPSLFSSVEQIADDTAIQTKISKEALNQNTNLDITIKVSNKDIPNAASKG
jgi:hypothetical protein